MTSGGKLPIELERLIFELAAETRSAIPNLILVAQCVRAWLEPLLYRSLQLLRPRIVARAIESVPTKQPTFLASTVRHVIVYASILDLHPETFVRFLESCPGITSLFIMGNITCRRLLPVLGNMRIQRLSVNLGLLFLRRRRSGRTGFCPVNMNHPLFAAVSHLNILDWFDIEDEEPQAMQWLKDLSRLPALTHLAFGSPPHPQVMSTVLDSCPRLDALLAMFPVINNKQDAAKEYLEYIGGAISDSRFVVAMYNEYDTDWELGARGGNDIWARAEEFIARKKCGEVEVGDYFLDASSG
ncbi:hypothetical protein B0H11DRAFT_1276209 [Mycena galericulata]|nr:hypothetical protein B0H11DRAFT_1276209 [Mycena galericulata]